MASSWRQYGPGVRGTEKVIQPLHLLLLLTLSLAAIVWAVVIITGRQGLEFERFLLLLSFYGIASATFLFSRIRAGYFRFFDIPVYLTVLAFVEFGLAPLFSFLVPEQLDYNFHGNYEPLVRALLYFTFGMVAFWIGCRAGESRRFEGRNQNYHPDSPPQSSKRISIVLWGVGIYCVAFATKVYLLWSGLFSYVGSLERYYANLASMQVLSIVSLLGTYALVVIIVERYCHPSNAAAQILFVGIFLSECLWGLISGVKGLFLQNFILVALVSSIVQRKFPKRWIAAVLLGLVVLYPVHERYRHLTRRERMEVTSATAAKRVGSVALQEAAQGESGVTGWLETGARSSLARLNLLQSLGLVLTLDEQAAALQGEERSWMIPFYPFVPRFLWSSKPILNKGEKFSLVLGRGNQTSTAITYPGDLYLIFGLGGILVGMFLLGVVGQWLTNYVSQGLDKRRLFVYTAIFLNATHIEIDVFSFWSTLIKLLVILSIVAWAVYGSRPRTRRVLMPLPSARMQP